jgi:hypothetical protein
MNPTHLIPTASAILKGVHKAGRFHVSQESDTDIADPKGYCIKLSNDTEQIQAVTGVREARPEGSRNTRTLTDG